MSYKSKIIISYNNIIFESDPNHKQIIEYGSEDKMHLKEAHCSSLMLRSTVHIFISEENIGYYIFLTSSTPLYQCQVRI